MLAHTTDSQAIKVITIGCKYLYYNTINVCILDIMHLSTFEFIWSKAAIKENAIKFLDKLKITSAYL